MGILEKQTTFSVETRSVKILNHKNRKALCILGNKDTNRGMSIKEIATKTINIVRGKFKIAEFT
jgi:hypothetical protein